MREPTPGIRYVTDKRTFPDVRSLSAVKSKEFRHQPGGVFVCPVDPERLLRFEPKSGADQLDDRSLPRRTVILSLRRRRLGFASAQHAGDREVVLTRQRRRIGHSAIDANGMDLPRWRRESDWDPTVS
jgi:hypothetical protein